MALAFAVSLIICSSGRSSLETHAARRVILIGTLVIGIQGMGMTMSSRSIARQRFCLFPLASGCSVSVGVTRSFFFALARFFRQCSALRCQAHLSLSWSIAYA